MRTPGGLVRAFRRRAGLTQRGLAEAAGMSVAAVRDLEQGRSLLPRASTLPRLSLALGLSAAEMERLRHPGQETLWIGVLGPLTVNRDGVELDLGADSQRALFGVLALTPDVPVGQDALARAVWGRQPPADPTGSLQSRISRLRRRLSGSAPARAGLAGGVAVPAVAITFCGSAGYQLTTTAAHHDLLAFRRLLVAARSHRAAGRAEAACTAYGRAVALWRGGPLAGMPELETHHANALAWELRSVVLEYAREADYIGRHGAVITSLRRIVDHDPLDEFAHAALMIALAGNGEPAAALRLYEAIRGRLGEELGTRPGAELHLAHARVLAR